MRVKPIAVVLLASSILLMSACGSDKDGGSATYAEPGNTAQTNGQEIINKENFTDVSVNPDESQEQPEGTAGQLYSLAFQAMFSLDEGLNGNMEYIALDLSELTQLTDQDKTYILDSFADYEVTVRDATFEELTQEEENFEDSMSLSGVLLQVKKVDVGEDSAVIEGSKYRSGTGAVGTKITLKLEDGTWNVTDSSMTWIS